MVFKLLFICQTIIGHLNYGVQTFIYLFTLKNNDGYEMK